MLSDTALSIYIPVMRLRVILLCELLKDISRAALDLIKAHSIRVTIVYVTSTETKAHLNKTQDAGVR